MDINSGEGWVGTDVAFTGHVNMTIDAPIKIAGTGNLAGHYKNDVDIAGVITKNGTIDGDLRTGADAQVFTPSFPTYSVNSNSSINCTAESGSWTGVNCPLLNEPLTTPLPANLQYGTIVIDDKAYFEAVNYDIGSIGLPPI